MIYLDSAATTPVHKDVVWAMLPWLTDNFANAGSPYAAGREAKRAINDARSKVARMFNSDMRNIVFTSGGSEGNSFAFLAAEDRLERSNKKHIIVSSVEHDSVLRAAEGLTKRGFYIDYIPVCRGGSVLIDSLKKLITPETGLVSVMYVNNETGAINDLEKIGTICHDGGILFHTDCVQAAGFLPIDVSRIKCDFATISAHKFRGPKGVGAVYVKDIGLCKSMIHGGHNQEFGIRGGTENTPGIVGMGVAAEIALGSMPDMQDRICALRRRFWDKIKDELKETVHLNGQLVPPSKVLNLQIDGVDADTLVLMMDSSGICISAGSACQSLELTPSRTLTAMGLTNNEARSSIRISFYEDNTEEHIDEAYLSLVRCINILRGDAYDI